MFAVMKGQEFLGTGAMNGFHKPSSLSNEASYVVDWNKLPDVQTYFS
jgi:hypothetical protein